MKNQISLEQNYQLASHFLSKLGSDWELLIKNTGPCLLRTQPGREPYEALIRAIAYQQLHTRAGDAMLNRFLALYPDTLFPSPQQVVATENETLRKCGFSARKVTTIQSIAAATLLGNVPTRAQAEGMSNEELIKHLVILPGIGQWTVEMLLIFTMERIDILPALDFGIREGYKKLKSLATRPSAKEMAQIAEPWSPYRTIAAWYLWQIR